MPLRIRVRKSAMGSVMLMRRLPARLRHPGDLPRVRQLAQAYPADAELAVHRPGSAAAAAARVVAGLELRRARLAHPLGGLGHGLLRRDGRGLVRLAARLVTASGLL